MAIKEYTFSRKEALVISTKYYYNKNEFLIFKNVNDGNKRLFIFIYF